MKGQVLYWAAQANPLLQLYALQQRDRGEWAYRRGSQECGGGEEGGGGGGLEP